MWNLEDDLWWSAGRCATVAAVLYLAVLAGADALRRGVNRRRAGRAVTAQHRAVGGQLQSAGFSMDNAVRLAETLLDNEGGDDRELWPSEAVFPLAAMLYAASGRGNGRGLAWVRELAAGFDDSRWGTPLAAAVSQRCGWLYPWVARVDGYDAARRAALGAAIRRAVGAYTAAVAS